MSAKKQDAAYQLRIYEIFETTKVDHQGKKRHRARRDGGEIQEKVMTLTDYSLIPTGLPRP